MDAVARARAQSVVAAQAGHKPPAPHVDNHEALYVVFKWTHVCVGDGVCVCGGGGGGGGGLGSGVEVSSCARRWLEAAAPQYPCPVSYVEGWVVHSGRAGMRGSPMLSHGRVGKCHVCVSTVLVFFSCRATRVHA